MQRGVVLVVIDTLRADHLGAYGYARATSPHLDAFASESTLFENAVSTAPWTLPAHATLFSGLHPKGHGVHINMRGGVHPDVRTLPQEFQARGYRTGAQPG